MDESHARLCEIQSRLEKLESENRRLKRIGALASLIGASLLLMGQAKSSRTVEAEKFVLRDANGNVRGELSVESLGRPTLTLRDAKGFPIVSLAGGEEPFLTMMRPGTNEQVTLSNNRTGYGLALYGKEMQAGLAVTDGVPALSLFDAHGKERATVDVFSDEPRLSLQDANDKAEIGVSSDGVILRDATGKVRAMFADLADGPKLLLIGPNENSETTLGVSADGPSLELHDTEGYSTIVGSTDLVVPRTGEKHKTSAASLTLFSKDKKVLWSAP
jgi:hypothetical protein